MQYKVKLPAYIAIRILISITLAIKGKKCMTMKLKPKIDMPYALPHPYYKLNDL